MVDLYTRDDRLAIFGIIVLIAGTVIWSDFSFIIGSVIVALGILLLMPAIMAIFGLSSG